MKNWYKVWTYDFSEAYMIIKANSLQEALAAARKENPKYTCGQLVSYGNRCKHYLKQQVYETRYTITGTSYCAERTAGFCRAAKNVPECKCKGNREKCDFYPQNREEKPL